MFNAEDIIELEKKWFKYKIKQKSKLSIFILLIIAILSFITYTIYFQKQINIPIQKTTQKVEKKEIKPIKKPKALSIENNNSIKHVNTTIITPELNVTKKEAVKLPKIVKKNTDSKPYHFKLEPTDQGSELFSSNGFLTLNLKYSAKKQDIPIEHIKQIVQPIRETQIHTQKQEIQKQKVKISIDMKEIDTIAYLKDKYYSTSSIVFALMLAEEYYYEKKYKNSGKV